MSNRKLLVRYQEKITSILLVNIFIQWLFNITVVHVNEFLPNSFYYAMQLSIFYWIGISLIICLLLYMIYLQSFNTLTMKLYKKILFILLLVLYLHGTSSYIFTNPRTLDSYTVIMLSNYFYEFKEGIFQTQGDYINQFPGGILLFNILHQMLNLNSFVIAKYYQICSVSFISLFIYLSSKLFYRKYEYLAPIMYISTIWITQYHFCPQSYAFMLVAVLFYLLAICFFEQFKNQNIILLLLIIWLAVTISHPATIIFTLISLFVLLVIFILDSKIKSKFSLYYYELKYIKNKITSVIFTYGIIFAGYVVYNSGFIIKRIIETIKDIINSFVTTEEIVTLVGREWVQPSASYMFGYYFRLFNMFSVLLVGFTCVFVHWFLYYRTDFFTYNFKRKIGLIHVVGFFIGYSSVLMGLSISGYNVYGSDRAYLFSLLPFSLLCVSTLNIDLYKYEKHARNILLFIKIVIPIFLFISIAIFPIVAHANDPYNFVSESEWSGKTFGFDLVNLTTNRHHYHTALIYPVTDAYYTHYYNYLEMTRQQGNEYKMNYYEKGTNILYNSGQFKLSEI
jgi:hypothetical protein